MVLTLNQAAKAAKRSKATLLAAIEDGRMSAFKSETGQWQIDPAELFRVFPATTETADETDLTSHPQELETALLIQQAELQRQAFERERALLEGVIGDLRRDRENWRMQAQSVLTYQPAPHSDRPETTPETGAVLKWSGVVGLGLAIGLMIWLVVMTFFPQALEYRSATGFVEGGAGKFVSAEFTN